MEKSARIADSVATRQHHEDSGGMLATKLKLWNRYGVLGELKSRVFQQATRSLDDRGAWIGRGVIGAIGASARRSISQNGGVSLHVAYPPIAAVRSRDEIRVHAEPDYGGRSHRESVRL
jgi:hypothetical protein